MSANSPLLAPNLRSMAEPVPTIYDAASFATRVQDTRSWVFQARAELAYAPTKDAADNVPSPFDTYRDTSSRLSLSTFAADTAVDRGIRAHVLWLLQKRLVFSFDKTIAGLRREPVGRLRLDRTESISFADAKHGLLTETHPARIEAYLNALASAAPEVNAQTRARAESRTEAARQLGLEAHDAPFMPLAPRDTSGAARLFLDRTRDVARAQRRAEEAGNGAILATFVRWTAEAARIGFPAKLNHAWLHDAFPSLATARIDPRSGHPSARRWLRHLPTPYFATSFARALHQLGGALGAAAEESTLARITRGDPSCLHEATVGNVFAALLLDPAFHRRTLGLSVPDARLAVRALAESALVTCRLRAASVRATEDAPKELSEEVFGAELPASLQTTFIFPHDDASRDFLAILRSVAMTRFLRDTFDEDWFRNPRTADFFLAAEAITMTKEEADALVVSTARAFEELLS